MSEATVVDANEGVAEGRSSKVRRRRARRVVLLAGGMLLLAVGSAMADLVGLPADGTQVNNDSAAGPRKSSDRVNRFGKLRPAVLDLKYVDHVGHELDPEDEEMDFTADQTA